MAEKASRRVKTLNSFIRWAAQFNDGQYLFRGVSNESYEIEASAYRRLPEGTRNNPDMLLRINQMLIERARLLGHDQKNGQPLSDLELHVEPDPQDHLQRGHEVYQRGDLEDAIDHYDEVIPSPNPEGDLE